MCIVIVPAHESRRTVLVVLVVPLCIVLKRHVFAGVNVALARPLTEVAPHVAADTYTLIQIAGRSISNIQNQAHTHTKLLYLYNIITHTQRCRIYCL